MTNPPQSTEDQPDSATGQYMEIGPSGARKRLMGLIVFLLFFIAVGAALVALFIYFTNSWTLAILLVGFMVLYMTFMGWLASNKPEQRE